MRFTYNWLKSYIDTKASIKELEDRLSTIGLEVEEVIDLNKIYNAFVIAKIEDCYKHPHADKLSVCKVYDGENDLQIVCGASNVRRGMYVVLAPVGSVIPLNKIIIQESSIRGVTSYGMLCSAEELLLPLYKDDNDDSIIELNDHVINDEFIGSKFAEYAKLNDYVLEIALTPNRRQDCGSIYGIARDLTASGLGTLKDLGLTMDDGFYEYNDATSPNIIDKDSCSEFCSFVMRNIKYKIANPTCKKIAQFLHKVDQLHEHPLVNISNFTMLSLGRPNHIYDLDKIDGKVVIRKSYDQEKFIALGGMEYILPEGICVIADSSKILAIGGVIGGELSKVDENTKNILVEVANFSTETVSAHALNNINTESKYRFEGRIDTGITVTFLCYIRKLLQESYDGNLDDTVSINYGNRVNFVKSINFQFEKYQYAFAGCDIDKHKAQDILQKLGYEINGDTLVVPTWRHGDVAMPEDIIEEIMRIYGINLIKPEPVLCNFGIDYVFEGHNRLLAKLATDSKRDLAEQKVYDTSTKSTQQFALEVRNRSNEELYKARSALLGLGFDEVLSWSFFSTKMKDYFNFNEGVIEIINPISADLSIMRVSIIPNLLDIFVKNHSRGYENLNLFECGNVFNDKFIDKQALSIAGLRSGYNVTHNIHKTKRERSFYDVRDDVMEVLFSLGYSRNIEDYTIDRAAPGYYHPGCSGRITYDNLIIANCGELHPNILEKLGIGTSKNIVVFEIDLEVLNSIPKSLFLVEPNLSQYQASYRDFAFFIDKEVMVYDIIKAINRMQNELIDDVKVFDVYYYDDSPKKSVAIRVKIQSSNRTLVDNEINGVSDSIIKLVKDQFNGEIRDSC